MARKSALEIVEKKTDRVVIDSSNFQSYLPKY